MTLKSTVYIISRFIYNDKVNSWDTRYMKKPIGRFLLFENSTRPDFGDIRLSPDSRFLYMAYRGIIPIWDVQSYELLTVIPFSKIENMPKLTVAALLPFLSSSLWSPSLLIGTERGLKALVL